ncbi:hypothetical protein MMC25_003158 [Agyrium rufum]|nr:hypothetical protein [Agyrium rufum]
MSRARPSTVPNLLGPLISKPPPSEALLLLTATLGTNSLWLILRYLLIVFSGDWDAQSDSSREEAPGAGTWRVVLVSFVRDLATWREGGKRLGLDVDQQISARKLIYVDLLNDPGFGLDDPLAGLESRTLKAIVNPSITTDSSNPQQSKQRTLLVVDGLDLWLSVLSIHAKVNIVQCRTLDTGLARDVSGVIRISQGGGYVVDEGFVSEEVVEGKDWEGLWFWGSDGSLKVWRRGGS